MNPATQLPLPVKCRLEIEAHDAAALRKALKAAHDAISEELEPNVLWAPQFRVGIIVGGTA